MWLLPLVAAVCALSACAKDGAPPRFNISDKPVDRDARGASYAAVIKRVTPSVVSIYSTRTLRVRPFWHDFFNDPLFRRFFGEEFPRPDGRSRTFKQQGLGSGVIVTDDGYILTARHVIADADKDGVEVALADGKTKYSARVIGSDAQTDVAVLKIEAKGLTPITLADSDKLEVGDVVLAVGNPFGVGQSVTMGIISALGRDVRGRILGSEGYEDFIQTDAPINPGNSGGALVDVEGRLIGINQSIVSGSFANAGVGFAIPINLARSVMTQLITKGKVARGYLGVVIQPVTPDLAREFNLPDESGALVGDVQPDTPAEKAGIKTGDVIVEFNGRKVNDSRHLRLLVAQTPPGSKATLKVLRDGKPKTLSLTLGTLPDELSGGSSDTQSNLSETQKADALEGVELADLDARLRRQYDIPATVRGAVVTSVAEDSPAAEAGLREGDVIQEINRQPVRNADEAIALSRKAEGDRILLRVWSSGDGAGGSRWLVLKRPKSS
ncbi:MAG: DegQ family serine endoprotease [Verrucomicrobiales bacterium]|nr:DegQ family serine endoprotease [Verrucomicrobiales bacterium]